MQSSLGPEYTKINTVLNYLYNTDTSVIMRTLGFVPLVSVFNYGDFTVLKKEGGMSG